MSSRRGNPLDKAFRRYFQDLWTAKMASGEDSAGAPGRQAWEMDVVVLPDRYEISLATAAVAGLVDDRQLLEQLAGALSPAIARDLAGARIVRSLRTVKVILPRSRQPAAAPQGAERAP